MSVRHRSSSNDREDAITATLRASQSGTSAPLTSPSLLQSTSRQNIATLIKSALGEGYSLNNSIQKSAQAADAGAATVSIGSHHHYHTNSGQNRKKASTANASFRSAESTNSLTAANDENFRKFRHGHQQTWNLTFASREDESGFERFFVTRTLTAWRWTIALSMVAYVLVYTYAMVKYPADSELWRTTYRDKTIPEQDMARNMQQFCPQGYFCADCPENIVCQDYWVWRDVVFLMVICVPGIVALGSSYLLPTHTFYRLYHTLASVFVLMGACVGVTVRFYVIEVDHNPLLPGVLMIFLLNAAFHGLQIRFIHSLAVLTGTVLVWLAANVSSDQYIDTLHGSVKANNKVVVGLALTCTAGLIVLGLRRNELFYRDQFLRGQYSNKVNKKLIEQLKALQQTYSTGVVDFETPLEKSLSILRSIMSDPSLAAEQFHSLELVIQLLNSPSLMTPDFEGQLDMLESGTLMTDNNKLSPAPGLGLDSDQRAWLFSEISKRRGVMDSNRRTSVAISKRKRKSVATNAPVTSGDIPAMPALPTLTAIPDSIEASRDGLKTPTSNILRSPDSTRTSRSIMEEAFSSADSSPALFHDPYMYAANREAQSRERAHRQGSSSDLVALAAVSEMMQLQRPKSDRPAGNQSAVVVQQLLSQVTEWNWKLFDFADACPGGKPLFILAHHLFDSTGLFEEFEIPLDKFSNFMWKIQEGYRNLPYHNSIHAADVLHAVNYFTQYDQIAAIAAPLDLLSMYFAAAIHDYDHPGVNNNFLASTHNGLAVLYNDKSVLESYHLSSAFSLLFRPEYHFLKQLPKADMQAVRDSVIDMVLATDLSQHYATLSQFKTRLQNSFNPGESKEDRALLYKMMIKCADVSNPTKEFTMYARWTNLVLDEWRTQGDLEKKMSIPVSPFMDRDNPNVLLSSQSGFIDFIIVPMFESVHNGFLRIPKIMEELERNRSHWAKLKEAKEENERIQAAQQNRTKQSLTDNNNPSPTVARVMHRPNAAAHAIANTRSLTMPAPPASSEMQRDANTRRMSIGPVSRPARTLSNTAESTADTRSLEPPHGDSSPARL